MYKMSQSHRKKNNKNKNNNNLKKIIKTKQDFFEDRGNKLMGVDFFFRRGKNVTLLTCLYILEYIRGEKYTDESLIIGE